MPSPIKSLTPETPSLGYKATLKIKLLSPMLGNIRTKDCRKFNIKDVSGHKQWEIKNDQWMWAITEAMDSMGLLKKSSADFIRLPYAIPAPKVNYYVRQWHDKTGKICEEKFECFSAGTVISFDVFVTGTLEEEGELTKHLAPPTRTELRKIFSRVGYHIGLSPWGSKFNFGRFQLLAY